MPPETPAPAHPAGPVNVLDPTSWVSRNPDLTVATGAICLAVSVTLIIRLWFIYPRTRFLKKLVWSIVLLVPFFGWFFYAGFFQPLDYNEDQGTTEYYNAMGGD